MDLPQLFLAARRYRPLLWLLEMLQSRMLKWCVAAIDFSGVRPIMSLFDASSATILEDDETESRGMLDFLSCRRAHHPDE